jgi:hypothetical protein
MVLLTILTFLFILVSLSLVIAVPVVQSIILFCLFFFSHHSFALEKCLFIPFCLFFLYLTTKNIHPVGPVTDQCSKHIQHALAHIGALKDQNKCVYTFSLPN